MLRVVLPLSQASGITYKLRWNLLNIQSDSVTSRCVCAAVDLDNQRPDTMVKRCAIDHPGLPGVAFFCHVCQFGSYINCDVTTV